jgi:glycosyltransferase involved in cell wall biosynthesis
MDFVTKERMKIAVYHNLPSGGGKRALREMVSRLSANHQIDVFSLSTANHDFCDLRPFAQRHQVYPFRPAALFNRPFGRVNPLIRTLDLYKQRALEKEIAAEIDRGGYDVVFVHSCQISQSPALLSFLHTPSVYYCAEPPRFLYEPTIPRSYLSKGGLRKRIDAIDPLIRLYRKVFTLLDRENIKNTTLVLTNSAYSRESIYRIYGVFPKVLYLGVDTKTFQPEGQPKENVVLSVGALRPDKGFSFVIESLARIPPEQRPGLKIVANYSDPRERAFLESLSEQQNVNLTIHLHIEEKTLIQFYNTALLTVYAPVLEPFGFVPLESMACGTPVVGIREAGIRESVRHQETGLLTERDPVQFAQAVDRLLGDGDCRERYGRTGRRYVETDWQWQETIAHLHDHLLSVIEKGKG